MPNNPAKQPNPKSRSQSLREQRVSASSGYCKKNKRCGGCQMIHLPYEQQLEAKQAKLERLLKPFCRVQPIIGMKNPYHYRNKVSAAFGLNSRREIISGVYQSNSHSIVSVDNCLLEDKTADRIVVTIRSLMSEFRLLPYNEDSRMGFLRHVLIRRGFKTGQIMVVLVTGREMFPNKTDFINALLQRHPEITTIVQNINGDSTSMVLGQKEKVLYGKGKIEDILCSLRFKISPRSFYQINPVQTEILYKKAMQAAALTKKDRVIDAYCGIGTIGMIAAKTAGQVIGVELNGDAVRDAKENARLNGIENIRFYKGDAGDFMDDMAQNGESADVVIMDPPRSGSSVKFLRSVIRLNPDRVVYVSCNPETLARDLAVLKKGGYRAVSAQGVDMFPHTEHCETVVLLSQQRPNDKIRVELDLTEPDITSAEKEATYQEIKDYILKKHGVKIPSLYIAQIKEKLGIKERENYNLTKNSDTKQPQCPKNKEKLIIDALKHFKMIAH